MSKKKVTQPPKAPFGKIHRQNSNAAKDGVKLVTPKDATGRAYPFEKPWYNKTALFIFSKRSVNWWILGGLFAVGFLVGGGVWRMSLKEPSRAAPYRLGLPPMGSKSQSPFPQTKRDALRPDVEPRGEESLLQKEGTDKEKGESQKALHLPLLGETLETKEARFREVITSIPQNVSQEVLYDSGDIGIEKVVLQNQELVRLEESLQQAEEKKREIYRNLSLLAQVSEMARAYKTRRDYQGAMESVNSSVGKTSVEIRQAWMALVSFVNQNPDGRVFSAYELWSRFPMVLDQLSLMLRKKPKTTLGKWFQFITDKITIRLVAVSPLETEKVPLERMLQIMAEKGDMRGIVTVLMTLKLSENEEITKQMREWMECAKGVLLMEDVFHNMEKALLKAGMTLSQEI